MFTNGLQHLPLTLQGCNGEQAERTDGLKTVRKKLVPTRADRRKGSVPTTPSLVSWQPQGHAREQEEGQEGNCIVKGSGIYQVSLNKIIT